jgi:hypothetical protein
MWPGTSCDNGVVRRAAVVRRRAAARVRRTAAQRADGRLRQLRGAAAGRLRLPARRAGRARARARRALLAAALVITPARHAPRPSPAPRATYLPTCRPPDAAAGGSQNDQYIVIGSNVRPLIYFFLLF